ncbi:hypothetical protein RhiirA4_161892 [Rhizophagus irregularis]|uniref:Uncharacterized protein n=1 Tax=Rhizophagus irregularis TaxID=588596 RepID=A0A2I1GEW9_9GLOM|nr:hypothetical protein RhiirA4_161892 [Rhizophagus irregularis]
MVILNNFGFIYLLRHVFFFYAVYIFSFFLLEYFTFSIIIILTGCHLVMRFFSFINKFFFTLVINSMCDGRTIR